MAPPDTSSKKQAKRHKPALIGIAVALAIALLAAILAFTLPSIPADEQATPVPPDPQPNVEGPVDGTAGTGAEPEE